MTSTTLQTFKGTPHAPYAFRVLRDDDLALSFTYCMATGTFEYKLTATIAGRSGCVVNHGDTGLRTMDAEEAENFAAGFFAQVDRGGLPS